MQLLIEARAALLAALQVLPRGSREMVTAACLVDKLNEAIAIRAAYIAATRP